MKTKIPFLLRPFMLLCAACQPAQESGEKTKESSQSLAGSEPAEAYILSIDAGETLINDQGHTTYIKVSPQTGSTNMAWMATDIPPGANILVHRHDRAEEVLFVHQGSGTFILGDERIEVGEGATIYVPPGTWHGMENPEEHVHIAFAVSPVGLEGFFREIMWQPGEGPKRFSPEEISEIEKLHDSVARPALQ